MSKNKYMSYESYSFINSLINSSIYELELSYRKACYFCPAHIDDAHKTYMLDYKKIKDVKDELHLIAQQTYKTHPNIEMRKFWGLKK